MKKKCALKCNGICFVEVEAGEETKLDCFAHFKHHI